MHFPSELRHALGTCCLLFGRSSYLWVCQTIASHDKGQAYAQHATLRASQTRLLSRPLAPCATLPQVWHAAGNHPHVVRLREVLYSDHRVYFVAGEHRAG